MTREEAIKWLEYHKQGEMGKAVEALNMAIEALEQESILDKIRAEIEQFADTHCSGDDINIYDVFQILDKYNAESEEV